MTRKKKQLNETGKENLVPAKELGHTEEKFKLIEGFKKSKNFRKFLLLKKRKNILLRSRDPKEAI